jgi:hypothetical protein
MEDIKSALETVQSWATAVICNRGSSIAPVQAVWAMYPHMQLLKATETILESMACAEKSKMVNLLELEEREVNVRKLADDNILQDNAQLHQDN